LQEKKPRRLPGLFLCVFAGVFGGGLVKLRVFWLVFCGGSLVLSAKNMVFRRQFCCGQKHANFCQYFCGYLLYHLDYCL
jgi:hypothetical protein